MFSRTDADALRNSLGPMQFLEATPRTEPVSAYCDFYGLNFSNDQRPVQHSLGRLTDNGFELVCQHFQLDVSRQRGTIFLLHGYFDHAGIYNHLIQHCLELGFSVVIVDLPGHGLSSGKPASIDSFSRYSAAFLSCLRLAQEQQVNAPWIAIGQSTGGAVLMHALLQDNLAARFRFDGHVLLAPLLRPRHWTRSKLLFFLTRPFIDASPRTFAVNSHDQEFLDFLKNSDALQSRLLHGDWVQAMIAFQKAFQKSAALKQPLHIIQGSDDGTVDWKYNLPQITAKFSGSKIYMIEGAGHHLVNEAERYRDRVFSVLANIIAGFGV